MVGIIPALKHETKSLNRLLNPAVDELNALWKGVKVNTHNSPSSTVKIQAAVLCFGSDIPAAKLCGFLDHSARRGCSHCYKEFPGGFGEQVVSRTGTSGQRDPRSSTEEMPTK